MQRSSRVLSGAGKGSERQARAGFQVISESGQLYGVSFVRRSRVLFNNRNGQRSTVAEQGEEMNNKSKTMSRKKKKPSAKLTAKKENRFQRHFRKFHSKETTGHPSYVFDEEGNKYKILGITGSPTTNGVLNVKLKKNPEPNNSRDAYVRPNPTEINKGVRNEKLKGWKFSEEDKKSVNAIIDKHATKKGHKKRKTGDTET